MDGSGCCCAALNVIVLATNSDFENAERGDIVLVDGTVPRAAFYDMPKEAVFTMLR